MSLTLLTVLLLLFTVGVIKPKWIFVAGVLLSVFQLGWISRYEDGSDYFNRISLLISLVALLVQFWHYMTGRIRINKFHVVTHILMGVSVVIVAHSAISSIYNNENIILSLYSYRYTIITLVVYNMALYYHINLVVTDFKKLIIGLAFFQIPFSIMKYLSAGGGLTNTLDSVTGTFVAYGSLVACQVTAITIAVNDLASGKKNVFRLNHTFTVLILIIPLVLSKSRLASFYIIFGMLTGLIFAYRNTNKLAVVVRKTFGVILLLGIVSGAMYRYFWLQQDYDLDKHSDPGYVWSYFTRQGSDYGSDSGVRMGRLRSIITSLSLISKSPIAFLFGYSPASIVDAKFLGMHGNYYFDSGALFGLGRTQISRILMGSGVTGLLVYLLVLKKLLSISSRSSKILNLDTSHIANMVFIILYVLSAYTVTLHGSYYSVILGILLARIQRDQICSRLISHEKHK